MDENIKSLYMETVDLHYNKIKKFCTYHLHRNPQLIEDCCQEVFLLYLDGLIKGRTIKNTGAWLRKVAYTEVIRLEKESSKRFCLEVFERVEDASIENQLSIEYDFIEEIIKTKFTDDDLTKMLREMLSEEEKIIFDGCFIRKCTPETLTKELQITTNNLYQKKWALKKKLPFKIMQLISEILEKL